MEVDTAGASVSGRGRILGPLAHPGYSGQGGFGQEVVVVMVAEVVVDHSSKALPRKQEKQRSRDTTSTCAQRPTLLEDRELAFYLFFLQFKNVLVCFLNGGLKEVVSCCY